MSKHGMRRLKVYLETLSREICCFQLEIEKLHYCSSRYEKGGARTTTPAVALEAS